MPPRSLSNRSDENENEDPLRDAQIEMIQTSHPDDIHIEIEEIPTSLTDSPIVTAPASAGLNSVMHRKPPTPPHPTPPPDKL